ncbi:MAG: glycosyltransferase family 2 protein [Elusimicrobia bacterium]|nr:glycosyltransferase family 2 protein [Elusimicrobiota bacterium]
MEKLLLSICIPTYNREKYLRETLSNVLGQIAELAVPAAVEVVVSDNASQDGTAEVVRSFRSANLVTGRNPANLGGALNLNKVIDMAKGEYCWLMGDDDLIHPGAVKKIVKTISANPGLGLIYVNYRNTDNPTAVIRLPGDMLFRTAQEYIDYGLSHFNVNEWDPAKFTFYTSLIVNRAKWNSVADSGHRFVAHVQRIHSFLPGSPVFLIADPLVTMNDSQTIIDVIPPSLLYNWLEVYWFMGVRYDRRLGFLRIMLRMCLGNFKYKTMKLLRKTCEYMRGRGR